MNEEKFRQRVLEVNVLLKKFRTMADNSDKRILRDCIRGIVKELTRV